MPENKDDARKKPAEKMTDEEFFEPLEDLLGQDQVEEEEDLDPDDPWDQEKIMRMRKGADRMNSLWD